MKFRDLLNEAKGHIEIDIDRWGSRWEGRERKEVAGNFLPKSWKSTGGLLLYLDSFDKKYTKNVKLKSDERIYRYETETTAIAGLRPLVKVNIVNGKVYFLTSRANEIDMPEFEGRGVDTIYLNIFAEKDGVFRK